VGNANVLQAQVISTADNIVTADLLGGRVQLDCTGKTFAPGENVLFAVRSEYLQLNEACDYGFDCEITDKSFTGGLTRIVLRCGKQELIATRHGMDVPYHIGDKVRVSWNAQNAVAVEGEIGDAI